MGLVLYDHDKPVPFGERLWAAAVEPVALILLRRLARIVATPGRTDRRGPAGSDHSRRDQRRLPMSNGLPTRPR